MGNCCNKRNVLKDKINNIMKDFYFRLIRQDFVIANVQEFNKTKKNYHEFWLLTKLLGIHADLSFQVSFWESAFVSYSETSLDGLLLVFLLLCQGETSNKLEYLKYYLSVNINLSKENDNTLIMNYYEFKKILSVYFSCLTTVPLETYLKLNSGNKISNESTEIINLNINTIREKFNDETIKCFTEFLIKDYVKKNFYINAGKFLDKNINFLTNDNLIRKTILKFKGGPTNTQANVVNKKGSLSSDDGLEQPKEGVVVELLTENKPLKQNNKKVKKVACCSSQDLKKNKMKTKPKSKIK